jgi:enediyne biosynthesis protein E4
VGQPPTLLLNRTQSSNHAVLFKLVGTKSNRAAVGARVSVTAGGVTQFSEVRSGTSYLSQNDLRLHFGLGAEATMNTVELLWPNGKKEVIKDLPADFIYTIVEDSGVQQKTPFAVESPESSVKGAGAR